MKRLTFPRGTSREPFQTWEQIERKVDALRRAKKRTPVKESSCWETLYLTEDHVVACIAYVRENAIYPFAHPMFVFCAYTGARRSEILRSEKQDSDFSAGSVSIRQKKAATTRDLTVRQVPIHPALADVMREWF
jgi:integrase